MRRKLLEAGKHHIAVPGEGEHQGQNPEQLFVAQVLKKNIL